MGVTALILAGGAGTRLQHSENKVYLPIADKPLLWWSLRTFDASPMVDDIVLVFRRTDRGHAEEVLARQPSRKLRAMVEGGATRHDSEYAGLGAVRGDVTSGRTDLIMIHDAARPFVSGELLRRVVDTARSVGGAIPGLAVERTIYRQSDEGFAEPVPVTSLRRVQTPQAFHAASLLRAYDAAARDGFKGVDTAQSIERYTDLPVSIVEGDPRNVKVTFVEDLFTVEELAADWPG